MTRAINKFIILVTVCFLFSKLCAHSSAEFQLVRVYNGLGLSLKEAHYNIFRMSRLLKKIEEDNVTESERLVERLSFIFRKGLILELSEYGVMKVKKTVQSFFDIFLDCMQPVQFSSKECKEFCVIIKPVMFKWLVVQLDKFDPVSFNYAYSVPDEAFKLFGDSDIGRCNFCIFKCKVPKLEDMLKHGLDVQCLYCNSSYNRFDMLKVF